MVRMGPVRVRVKIIQFVRLYGRTYGYGSFFPLVRPYAETMLCTFTINNILVFIVIAIDKYQYYCNL